MRILAVSSTFILLGAFLAVCSVLFFDVRPLRPQGPDGVDLVLSTVPSQPWREAISADISLRATRLEASHGSWLGRKREALRPLWGVAVLRATVALGFLPPAFAMVGTALAVGLSRRERAKLTFAYCSTTWSYVGKHAVAYAIAGYIITAFCPIGFPVWMLYVFAFVAALGAGLYVAHLPPKI
ncbi:MAG TPA: hypothetical protein VG457_00735 [Planctomycetota bacterium]|nr:hypothetical protein [Planctomycetota bacterium]